MMKEKIIKKSKPKSFYAVGRRKTAVAQVRMSLAVPAEAKFLINGKDYTAYLSSVRQQIIVKQALTLANYGNQALNVKVMGGGIYCQAEAIRNGIAAVFVKFDPSLKKIFKAQGFLTRDSRAKERKKPGLKRARRAPQWQKR